MYLLGDSVYIVHVNCMYEIERETWNIPLALPAVRGQICCAHQFGRQRSQLFAVSPHSVQSGKMYMICKIIDVCIMCIFVCADRMTHIYNVCKFE